MKEILKKGKSRQRHSPNHNTLCSKDPRVCLIKALREKEEEIQIFATRRWKLAEQAGEIPTTESKPMRGKALYQNKLYNMSAWIERN